MLRVVLHLAKSKPNQIFPYHRICTMTSDPRYDVAARINPADRQNCNHGDIFNPGDYRFADAEIACWNPDTQQMTFINNPDESEAGYLTLPASVLANVKDSVQKYQCLWQSNCSSVNMHVSPNDKLIEDRFGSVDIGWKFDVWYAHGQLETFFISPPGGSASAEFMPDVDWQTVVKYFDGRKGPQSTFKVQVQLEGDDFIKYKDKYTTQGSKYSWMQAAPTFDGSWRLEKGASSMGANKHSFTWILQGPAEQQADVKANVQQFLAGFQFTFVSE